MVKKLLFILLLIPYFSFGQNLIPNGDFELGPDSTSVGWQVGGFDSTCSLIAYPVAGPDFWVVTLFTPDRIFDGDTCAAPNITTAQSGLAYIHFAGGEAGKAVLLSPMEKDSVYRFSYYANVNTGCPQGPPASFVFKFNGGDSIVSPLFYNTTSWQYYDTIFTASNTSTEIEIVGNGLPLQCAGVDNVRLQKLSSISVQNKSNKTYVKIYPNPTSGIFTVSGAGEITIFDLFGRLLLRTNKKEIDMSSYPKGVYVLRVGEATSKLILQ